MEEVFESVGVHIFRFLTEDEISGFTIINDKNSGRNGYGTFELSRADDNLVNINNTVCCFRFVHKIYEC